MPVTPVQLENLALPDYLKEFRVLVLTYHGMKPLTADVHPALAAWVRGGGMLVVCDDDSRSLQRRSRVVEQRRAP